MSVQQRFLLSPTHRAVLLAVLLPGAVSGCDHQQKATEAPTEAASETEVATLRRENAALRTRVQNLEERVRLIENGRMAGGGSTSLGTTGYGYESYSVAPDPDAWAEPTGDGPRELPVVKLTPDERSKPAAKPAAKPGRSTASISLSPLPNSGVDEYADTYVDARDELDEGAEAYASDEPSSGEPASYRLVGSKLVQATKRKPVVATKSSGDRDSSVARDYKAAMSIYDEGRYAEAEQAFAAIVASHPNDDYADNALYWQGEAAYDQAHYADALAAFTKVVERYGGGSKAPDALLKIGLCYGRLGDSANARDVLSQLVAAYPRAEASKIAKRKLADLDD